MTEFAPEPARYEVLLRAVGAWLDERSPERFTVMETLDGFAVVRHARGSDTRCSDEVTRESLLQDDHERRERRGSGKIAGGQRAEDAGTWMLAPDGREDMLRAIGHELDDDGASMILLDELRDVLFLTYTYTHPDNGATWHRRMVRLDVDGLAQIRADALRRRGAGGA